MHIATMCTSPFLLPSKGLGTRLTYNIVTSNKSQNQLFWYYMPLPFNIVMTHGTQVSLHALTEFALAFIEIPCKHCFMQVYQTGPSSG
jgi:hypothetical protein